jgi:hypothetical protein
MWHVMRFYSYFGHTDFVLCLRYGASAVKDFSLNHDETSSNDFVLENGAREVKLFSTDISDWRVTSVDTGLNSSIGERRRRVRRFVDVCGSPTVMFRRPARRRCSRNVTGEGPNSTRRNRQSCWDSIIYRPRPRDVRRCVGSCIEAEQEGVEP